VRFAVGLGLAALAFDALDGQRGELSGASGLLAALRVHWLVAGVASEAASLLAFAGLERRLLRAGGTVVGLPALTAVTFAAGAIASSLPAGPAVSTVFSYRQYRRRGAEETVAVWVLVATFVITSLSLALLAAAGLVVAQRQGAAEDLVGVTVAVLGVALAVSALLWQKNAVIGVAVRAVRTVSRVLGRPRGEAGDVVARALERLKAVRLGPVDLGVALGCSLFNWLGDCGCLVFSYAAVGAPVPWRGLLLSYGAAQLAANLPLTPGGLGVVEGSLTIGLVAFGGARTSTVAAVLLYRIVSFWGFLPVGWLSWAGLAWRGRGLGRRQLARAVAGVSEGGTP
jgi:uncharacterized protein (TIRG00374 family)